MTKQEQVREHLRSIRYFSSPGIVWDGRTIVLRVQEELDAIKKLLEPEPEGLASSVLRLTNICNELGRENAILRNDLTDMTLNYNAAEKYAKKLKHDLNQAGWDATKLKRTLALREQCLTRVQGRLERIKLGLEGRFVEEENRKLKRELEEAEELKQDLSVADLHIEELQADIAKKNEYIETLKQELVDANLRTGQLREVIDGQYKCIELLEKERRHMVNELSYRTAWNRRR